MRRRPPSWLPWKPPGPGPEPWPSPRNPAGAGRAGGGPSRSPWTAPDLGSRPVLFCGSTQQRVDPQNRTGVFSVASHAAVLHAGVAGVGRSGIVVPDRGVDHLADEEG